MKLMRLLLLGAALFATAGANAAETGKKGDKMPLENMTVHQLVIRAKTLTAAIWGATSTSVMLDEHDLVVEFRVSEGDKRVRESLMAFIELAAEFGEREKEQREFLFSNETPCMAPQNNMAAACRFSRRTSSESAPHSRPWPALPWSATRFANK